MSFDKDDQLERDGYYRREAARLEAVAEIRADLDALRTKVLDAMLSLDLGRELTAAHGALCCVRSDLERQHFLGGGA